MKCLEWLLLLLSIGIVSSSSIIGPTLLVKDTLFLGVLANGTMHAFNVGQNSHTTSMELFISIIRLSPFTSETQQIGFCKNATGPSCALQWNLGTDIAFTAEYYYDHYFLIGTNTPEISVSYAIKWCDKKCSKVCNENCAGRGSCDLTTRLCTCDSYVPIGVASETNTSCAVPLSSSEEGLGISEIIIIVVACGMGGIAIIVIIVIAVRKSAKKIKGQKLSSKSPTLSEQSATSPKSTSVHSSDSVELAQTPTPKPTTETSTGPTTPRSTSNRSSPPPPSLLRENQVQTNTTASKTTNSSSVSSPEASLASQQQIDTNSNTAEMVNPNQEGKSGQQVAYVHAEPSASGVFLVSYGQPQPYGPGAVIGPYANPENQQQPPPQQTQTQKPQRIPTQPTLNTNNALVTPRQTTTPPLTIPPNTATNTTTSNASASLIQHQRQPTASSVTQAQEESSWGGES